MSALLQDYLRDQGERDGDAVALVMGEAQLTYAELEAASNRLARQILESGCRRGDRIGLLTRKSPEAIVAMMASLKAGCAYVPLDVGSPPERLGRITGLGDPALLLIGDGGAELCEDLTALAPGPLIGAVDQAAQGGLQEQAAFGPEDTATQSAEPLERVGRTDDLAHILFTSGSTGAPKGVMITHANVCAFIDWAVAHFGIRPGDRISGHPPLHFDLSTFDIFGSLAAGAALHLVPGNLVLARQLADLITDHELTQWFSVPSALTYMARFGGLPESGFPTLERVLWCGEVLPTPVLISWMKRVPQARYTNLYGPTEATIASTFHAVHEVPADPGAPIPIGRPCEGEDVFVLGGDGGQLAAGEVGEIHIAGAGVSPGYWRDERNTQASFVADPRSDGGIARIYRTGDLGLVDATGVLSFVGRRDSQIKSRGYRIELGEIETAISALPEVAECAVVAVSTHDFAGIAICCALVPADGGQGDIVALRAALATKLPAYMLPSRWQRLDGLPKNLNGKIDRAAVTDQFAADRPTETR
jgi:amino acid adenylation domain-containing protein